MLHRIAEWFTSQIEGITLTKVTVLAIIGLFQVWGILWWKRNEFFNDLRGRDKRWQFPEVAGIIWLTFFPITITISLLGGEIKQAVWDTLEFMFFIAVLGRSARTLIEAKWGIPGDSTEKRTVKQVTEVETTVATTPKKEEEETD